MNVSRAAKAGDSLLFQGDPGRRGKPGVRGEQGPRGDTGDRGSMVGLYSSG